MAYIIDVAPKINSRVEMHTYIAVVLLSAELAAAAPALPAQKEAIIPTDWAAAPPPVGGGPGPGPPGAAVRTSLIHFS